MDKRTIRVPDDVAAEIDRRAEEHDVSESEAARQLLRRGIDADDLKTENERLRNEKRALVSQREEHGEALEFIEEEREVRRRREERIERREERRNAPLWRRARWYVFGRD